MNFISSKINLKNNAFNFISYTIPRAFFLLIDKFLVLVWIWANLSPPTNLRIICHIPGSDFRIAFKRELFFSFFDGLILFSVGFHQNSLLNLLLTFYQIFLSWIIYKMGIGKTLVRGKFIAFHKNEMIEWYKIGESHSSVSNYTICNNPLQLHIPANLLLIIV